MPLLKAVAVDSPRSRLECATTLRSHGPHLAKCLANPFRLVLGADVDGTSPLETISLNVKRLALGAIL